MFYRKVVFLLFRLFKKYPEAQEEFPALVGQDEATLRANPDLSQQVEFLRKGMDSLVMNLKNKDALDVAMEKLAFKHKEREMDPEYFKASHNTAKTWQWKENVFY